MDQSLLYNFGGIEGLSAEIVRVMQKLDDRHSELEAKIRALGDTWIGDNVDAYKVVQSQWNSSHKELLATLNGIGNAVRSGGETMGRTEANLTNGWFSRG